MKYMIETYRAAASSGPRGRAESRIADPDGYIRESIGPVEAETAKAALIAHAAEFLDCLDWEITSKAARYGGEPFVDQAHGQANRQGTRGAQAVRIGFDMTGPGKRPATI